MNKLSDKLAVVIGRLSEPDQQRARPVLEYIASLPQEKAQNIFLNKEMIEFTADWASKRITSDDFLALIKSKVDNEPE
jgi:hypothetical protein